MATLVGQGGENKRCPKCRLRFCICEIKDKLYDPDDEPKVCVDCGLTYCICNDLPSQES